MPAGRTLVVAVCAVAAAAVTLTGCNDDDDDGSAPIVVPAATTSAKADPFPDLTATQLLKRAERDMRDAGAMTYELSTTDDDTPLHMKAAATSGGACVAAVDMDGGKAQFIVPGGDEAYVKGDQDFWEENADSRVARMLAGKWVKVPASEMGESSLSSFCDLDSIVDSMAEDPESEGTTLEKGEPAVLDGKQVATLVQMQDGVTSTLYVSTGDTPYIVRAVTDNDPPDKGVFSDFGKQPEITVPPRAQTVDPEDFGPGTVHI